MTTFDAEAAVRAAEQCVSAKQKWQEAHVNSDVTAWNGQLGQATSECREAWLTHADTLANAVLHLVEENKRLMEENHGMQGKLEIASAKLAEYQNPPVVTWSSAGGEQS